MTISLQLDEDKLRRDVLNTLQSWGKSNELEGSELDKLTLTRTRRKSLLSDKPYAGQLVVNDILFTAIKALSEEDEQAAEILQERFLNKKKVQAVTNKLNFLNQDQTKRAQRNAIEHLTHILLKQEMAFRQAQIHTIESQLPPPPYNQSGLFGVEDSLATLTTQLLVETVPWVIVITGIGGIGKTSLADALLRCVIPYFQYDSIIWLRIESEKSYSASTLSDKLVADYMMSQLALKLCPEMSADTNSEQRNIGVRQALKANPCLIVVDNLEFELDAAYLFRYVNDLANPSKFLMTSRTRPPGRVGIYVHPLTDLSLTAATQLINHHAQDIGLTDLVDIKEADVLPIYEIIGGNPLALKLVVSLAAILPLPQIMADLTQARTGQIENMYRRIYQVVWESLSEDARTLLEMMPLASASGMGEQQMAAVSGLPQKRMWTAITELVQRSLLEVWGTIHERRYGLHHLTEAFLKTDIIGLPGESCDD